MQEEKSKASTEQSTPKPNLSIGALLVDARNRTALNQTYIAEQLNLPISKINALENDDYENLPESTYVRGYLRSYARLVGLDAEEIVKTYVELHHTESELDLSTSAKPSYDSAFLWSTAAVLTILVGLLVTWWVEIRNNPEQVVQLTSIEEVQSISENGKEMPSVNTEDTEPAIQESDVVEAEPVETQETEPVDEQFSSAESVEYVTEEVEQAMEEESKDPTLVSMSNESDVLTVTFVEKSWTEILDADSNMLMQGLIESGVVKNLNGKPPFHIFLGNSPGVVIEVNGQYFDQSEFNRSNRTARFQVSGSSFN